MAGTRLHCPRCGFGADEQDQFCGVCGTRLTSSARTPATSDDRVVSDQGSAAAVSDRGLVHARNEDAFFLEVVAGHTLAVVCDGVSSSTAPEVASRVGADAAGAALRAAADGSDPAESMRGAINAARSAVAAISSSPIRNHVAPSTTIVAVSCAGDEMTIGTLGDSRAYWIDGHDDRRLTRDDSWAEEQIVIGALDAREVALDPRAHMITAWLGADAPNTPPRVVSFLAPRRGRLIVCTDGMWNTWPEAQDLGDLARGTGVATTSFELASRLTDRAIAAGGRDNITVVVVDVDPTRTGPEEAP